MPGTFSKTRAAAILAECEFNNDETIAERWGVSVRTITNYRRRLDSDPKLADLFHQKKKELSSQWSSHAAGTLLVALEELQRRIPLAQTKEDADLIYAISGCCKIVGEMTITASMLLEDGPPVP